MVSKEEVLAKIEQLKTYSTTQNALTAQSFVTLETAVNTYYNQDFKTLQTTFNDMVLYMFCDISRRTTKFEKEFESGLPTDFPKGYDNLELCFYQFEELLTISNADFYKTFKITTSTDGTGNTTSTVENPTIDRWVVEITKATTEDFENVAKVSSFVENSSGNYDMINLFEDRGRTIKSLTPQEIAHEIYNTRKVKSVANALDIKVYIPTYLR